MYGKYKDISSNLKGLRTCGVCHERPIFFCDDDLRIHERNFHRSHEEAGNEDLEAIKSQLSLLTSVLVRQERVDFQKSAGDEGCGYIEEQMVVINNKMVRLEHEVNDLRKRCGRYHMSEPATVMCTSCVKTDRDVDRRKRLEEECEKERMDEISKIKSLKENLIVKTKEVDQLRDKRSVDKQKLRKLKGLFDDKQKMIVRLENEVASVKKEREEVEKRIESTEQKFIRIKGQLEIERKAKQKEDNKVDSFVVDKREYKSMKVERFCTSLQQELTKVKYEKAESIKEADRLRSLLQDKQSALIKLQEDVAKHTTTKVGKSENDLQLQKVEMLLAEKADALEKLQCSFQKAEDENQSKEEKIGNLRVMLREKNEMVQQLETKLEEQESSYKNEADLRNKKVSSLIEKIEGFETVTAESKTRMLELQKQLLHAEKREEQIMQSSMEKDAELVGFQESAKIEREQMQKSVTTIQALEKSMSQVSRELLEMEEKNKRLFKEKSAFQLQFDELSDQYRNAMHKAVRDEERMKRLEDVKQERDELKKKNELLEVHKDELMAELSLKQNETKQIESFEWRLKVAKERNGELEKEITVNKRGLKNAENEIADLKREHQDMLSAANQVQKLNKEFMLEKTEFEKISTQLVDKTQTITDMELKNRELSVSMETFKNEILEKKNCLDNANNEIEKLKNDLQQVNVDLNEAKTINNDLSGKLKENETLPMKLEKKTVSLEETEAALEDAEGNITKLIRQLAAVEEELDSAEKNLSTARQIPACMSGEIESLKQKNDIAELEKIQVCQQQKDLEKELLHLKDVHSFCGVEKQRLKEEVDNIRMQLHSVTNDLDQTLGDFRNAKDEMKRLQDEVTQYEERVMTLNAENNEAKKLKTRVKELELKRIKHDIDNDTNDSESDASEAVDDCEKAESDVEISISETSEAREMNKKVELDTEEHKCVSLSDGSDTTKLRKDEMLTQEEDGIYTKQIVCFTDNSKVEDYCEEKEMLDNEKECCSDDEEGKIESNVTNSGASMMKPIKGSMTMFAAPDINLDDESISEEIGEECEESVASDICPSIKDDESDYMDESFEIEDDNEILNDDVIDTCQANKVEEDHSMDESFEIEDDNETLDDDVIDTCQPNKVEDDHSMDESFEFKSEDEVEFPDESSEYEHDMIDTCQSTEEKVDSIKKMTEYLSNEVCNIKTEDELIDAGQSNKAKINDIKKGVEEQVVGPSFDDVNSIEDSQPKMESTRGELVPLTSASKSKLGKLSPLKHKCGSGLLDLPLMPVAGLSCSLTNKKEFVMQESVSLEVPNGDGVDFDNDGASVNFVDDEDIDALLSDLDEFEKKRTTKSSNVRLPKCEEQNVWAQSGRSDLIR